MKNQVVEKLSALITAAFGLVAALAWNSAIQAIFKKYYGEVEGIVSMLIYAFIVTVIAVIATVWIGKISARVKDKNKK